MKMTYRAVRKITHNANHGIDCTKQCLKHSNVRQPRDVFWEQDRHEQHTIPIPWIVFWREATRTASSRAFMTLNGAICPWAAWLLCCYDTLTCPSTKSSSCWSLHLGQFAPWKRCRALEFVKYSKLKNMVQVGIGRRTSSCLDACLDHSCVNVEEGRQMHTNFLHQCLSEPWHSSILLHDKWRV